MGLAGYSENLFHHTGSTPLRRPSFEDRTRTNASAQSETNSLESEYTQFICSLMQQL